jgi:hypothetical protein
MTKSVQAPHLLCVQKLISNTPSKRTIILVGLPNFSPTAPPSQFGGPLFGLSHFFFLSSSATLVRDPSSRGARPHYRHDVIPSPATLRLAATHAAPTRLLHPGSLPPPPPQIWPAILAPASPRPCNNLTKNLPSRPAARFDAAIHRRPIRRRLGKMPSASGGVTWWNLPPRLEGAIHRHVSLPSVSGLSQVVVAE